MAERQPVSADDVRGILAPYEQLIPVYLTRSEICALLDLEPADALERANRELLAALPDEPKQAES